MKTTHKVVWVVSLVLAVALAAGAAVGWERLRHLAVPTLKAAPAVEPAPAVALTEELGTEVRRLTNVGRRVAALAVAPDGKVWIGLFDGGVFWLDRGGDSPQVVRGLVGRERFVSSLAVLGDRAYAATFAGVVELSPEGKRARLHLEGVATESLVSANGRLYAGTARGVFVLGKENEFKRLAGTDVEGQPLRVTALTHRSGELWLATPRGAYAWRSGLPAPRWAPLVFGEPGATTNVATAVAATEEGVVVGTDDGGVAWISTDGTVHAARFGAPRANEVNPGASATFGACAAFGTQGAGVLLAPPAAGGAIRRLGPLAQVSALVSDGERLLAGTQDGEVLELRLPADACTGSEADEQA